MAKKTVLVTGCSEGGLGCALAHAFADKGFHVFATVRDRSKATSLASRSDDIDILLMEVTSPDSVASCVAHVRRETGGRLDVLVNNAGFGFIMPLLDTSIDEAKRLFDVNVWGMLAVTQAFAPLIIEAKGAVLNVSSLAGAVQMAWQGTSYSEQQFSP